MRTLEVSDSFECTPLEFWDNFFDPAFVARLDAHLGFSAREELQITEDQDRIHTRFRVTPKRELPPHIQQMMQNGLKMLQQVVNSGTDTTDLPEPMRKVLDWGKSTFKDLLKRDPRSPDSGRPPQLSLTYIEDATFNKHERILRWTITPDLFRDVSAFKGTIEVIPNDSGCTRRILGEIHLGIPGAGEMIEQFLVDEIRRNHESAAELTRKALQERKQKAAELE